jgi:hypothetical protein
MNDIVVIDGEVSLLSQIDGEAGVFTYLGRHYEYYEGSYQATPTNQQQIFETQDKIMRYDFEVEEIPYAERDNLLGGKTVIIG